MKKKVYVNPIVLGIPVEVETDVIANSGTSTTPNIDYGGDIGSVNSTREFSLLDNSADSEAK